MNLGVHRDHGGVNVLNVILGVKRDFRELKESKSFWKLKGDCERVKSKRRFLDVNEL